MIEILATLTIIVTGIGALFALRRQGNSLITADNSGLRKRVDDLESTNSYLLQRLNVTHAEHMVQLDELRKENQQLREEMWNLQQEIRDVKSKRDEYLSEIAGLRAALKQ